MTIEVFILVKLVGDEYVQINNVYYESVEEAKSAISDEHEDKVDYSTWVILDVTRGNIIELDKSNPWEKCLSVLDEIGKIATENVVIVVRALRSNDDYITFYLGEEHTLVEDEKLAAVFASGKIAMDIINENSGLRALINSVFCSKVANSIHYSDLANINYTPELYIKIADDTTENLEVDTGMQDVVIKFYAHKLNGKIYSRYIGDSKLVKHRKDAYVFANELEANNADIKYYTSSFSEKISKKKLLGEIYTYAPFSKVIECLNKLSN